MKRRIPISSGVNETITRPIIRTVIRDLMKKLNISDTEVKYSDETIVTPSDTSRDTSSRGLPNKLIEIKMTESPDSNEDVSGAVLKEKFGDIYRDDEINANASLRYRGTEMTLEITFKSLFSSDIDGLKSVFNTMAADNSNYLRHTLPYRVVLPETFKSLILAIHTIKKTVYPASTLQLYAENTFDSKRLERLNPLSGEVSKAELVISEAQSEVLGYISGTLSDTKEEKEEGYYVINMVYILNYKKPIMVMADYEDYIFNKKLPSAFTLKDNRRPDRNLQYSSNMEDLHELTKKHDAFGIHPDGYYLTYPKNDTFNLDVSPIGYQTVFSLLLTVEDEQEIDIFDISNIGGIEFKPHIVDLLKSEGSNVGDLFGSLFYFAVYSGNKVIDNKVFIDENGIVKLSKPLDKRKSYRIFIFLINRLNVLKDDSVYRIKKFLNAEIEANLEKTRTYSKLPVEEKMTSDRERVGKGLETIDTETFIDTYFEFFNVPDEEFNNALTRVTVNDTADILFKISLPNYTWGAMTSYHHVNVTRLLKGA